ncbi:hypothetical protein [Rhodococcus sp. OK302]|uniref:hypothetical protein n=1 Tax=Rhodococcus sp. OK302 TaxID=1882769 RepID=UPI0011406C6A|nr:hypothetical protein [Rhodococcus sp. OK302]
MTTANDALAAAKLGTSAGYAALTDLRLAGLITRRREFSRLTSSGTPMNPHSAFPARAGSSLSPHDHPSGARPHRGSWRSQHRNKFEPHRHHRPPTCAECPGRPLVIDLLMHLPASVKATPAPKPAPHEKDDDTMSGLMTFTITDRQVDAGKCDGMSLYTATTDGRTILLEAPNEMYKPGQTDTSILTDISHVKDAGGKADYWIGINATF